MFSLLQEISKLSEDQQAVKERYEDYTAEDLYQEILAQYKNLDAFRSSIEENPMELHRVGGGIIGSARDLAEAVNRFMKTR